MKRFIIAASALCLTLILGAAVLSAADGKTLYAKCAACHGADGAKSSGGMRPLKGMPEADFTKAMNGYKDKTFGGEKKAIMEGQAKNLSAEDIKALAQYVATF